MKQLLSGQNLQQMSLRLGTCLKHFLFICDLWPLFVRDKNCKAQRKQKNYFCLENTGESCRA